MWFPHPSWAAEIDPLARGVGYLLSETGVGVPRRIKSAYLATYAAHLRHGSEAA